MLNFSFPENFNFRIKYEMNGLEIDHLMEITTKTDFYHHFINVSPYRMPSKDEKRILLAPLKAKEHNFSLTKTAEKIPELIRL
jgi:hypothetical protein